MPAPDQGIQTSLDRHRYLSIPRTLIFLTREDRVLLLKGAPDKPIWAGKWNGVGGHVERDESVLAGALREAREETGLRVDNARLAGILHIDAGHPDCGVMLYVFVAEAPHGEPTGSREGDLRWFPRDALPEADLVEDLKIILPKALDRPGLSPPFFGRSHYAPDGKLTIAFA